MMQLSRYQHIFIATHPIDFRAGIDKLIGLCRRQFQLDPLDGHVFIFTNRTRKALKLLVYDQQGFWLCHKRLSQGKFSHWPRIGDRTMTLTPAQTHVLLDNGDPLCVDTAPAWR